MCILKQGYELCLVESVLKSPDREIRVFQILKIMNTFDKCKLLHFKYTYGFIQLKIYPEQIENKNAIYLLLPNKNKLCNEMVLILKKAKNVLNLASN